jgi:uncharacterized membrane protein YkoI
MKSNPLAIATVAAAMILGLSSAARSQGPAELEQAISHANVSLKDALQTAEQQAGGGHTLKADFHVKGEGSGYYDVSVLSDNGKVAQYRIDGNTGKVIQSTTEPAPAKVHGLDPSALRNVQTSLPDAIATAEQSSGGKAIGAAVNQGGGQVLYAIKVARADGGTEKVTVNGSNGKVASKD